MYDISNQEASKLPEDVDLDFKLYLIQKKYIFRTFKFDFWLFWCQLRKTYAVLHMKGLTNGLQPLSGQVHDSIYILHHTILKST